MTTIKEPLTEISHGRINEITIKQIVIDESNNSLNMTYRRDKEGNIICTGFDVKVFGKTNGSIKSKTDQLIMAGFKSINQTFPKKKKKKKKNKKNIDIKEKKKRDNIKED